MPAVWLTVLVRLGWFVTKQHDLTTDSEDHWPVIFAAAVAGYTPLSDQASIRKLEVVQLTPCHVVQPVEHSSLRGRSAYFMTSSPARSKS
jgi:hypothetical protein